MTNHLLVSNDVTEHYFSTSTGGISLRKKGNDNQWTNAETIIPDAKGPFCVYGDNTDKVHLIYITSDGVLSYGIRHLHQWKTYNLTPINPQIIPKRMQLCRINDNLNLLASVEYKGENLLIGCTLGNNSQPRTIDKMSNLHFTVQDGKVYYTNSHKNAGYVPLQEENNYSFFRLYKNAENFSVYPASDNQIILFTRDSKLYINNKEVIYDSSMEFPVLSASSGILYVMWKSGGYVRYITSANGNNWTSPMRFMTAGAEIRLFSLTNHTGTRLLYGYNSQSKPHLFPHPI